MSVSMARVVGCEGSGSPMICARRPMMLLAILLLVCVDGACWMVAKVWLW
jgi:hypothetical protein